MAREKIKLTWEPVGKQGRGRYKRMVRGKLFKSPVVDQDSRRNKSDAWQLFLEWRKEQDRQRIEADPFAVMWQRVIEATKKLLDRLKAEGDTREWTFWNEQLAVYRLVATGERFEGIKIGLDGDWKPVKEPDPTDTDTLPFLMVSVPHEVMPRPWDNEPEPADPDTTAPAVVDRYLDTLRVQVESGQRSTGLYGQTRSALAVFVEWFGETRGLDTLCEADVIEYHGHLSGLIGSKSQSTVATYQKLWRTFVDAVASDGDDIPRPANLRSKRYTITPGKAKVEVFTVDECRAFLELSSDRVELWLLLMLNCGMTQKDISDLDAAEVDWNAGRVIRSRSKEENAPTINWKLWDRTFALLAEQGNRSGAVLTKTDGGPLVASGIKPDGKEWRTDAVVSSWRHVVGKAKRHERVSGDWNKSLKMFRKTAASLIETSPHAEFVDVFLDHTRVARTNYLVGGQVVPKFDEAVLWLGERLGIE